MKGTGLDRWMIVPIQIQFVLSFISINQGWLKDIIPEIQRLMIATVQDKMISNCIGSFRPNIVVSELILQSLELMMLKPTILVMLVSGGIKVILKSSTTILKNRLLTAGGLKEGD